MKKSPSSTRWLEMAVTLSGPHPETLQELCTQAFADKGIFEVVLESPGETGLVEPGRQDQFYRVIAYLPESENALGADLARTMEDIAASLGGSAKASVRQRDDSEWRDAWKPFFKPTNITSRLVVRPSWEPYAAKPGEKVITIDPGLAFGTGTHATTTLVMALMEGHINPSTRFLDVGTGSGILMIAAALLGAAHVTGCDNDPTAIETARENLIKNKVEKNRYSLLTGDLTEGVAVKDFSLMAANIEAGPVIRLLEQIAPDLAKGCLLVLSGILVEQQESVKIVLAQQGLEALETRQKEEWVAILARKKV
ncbi:MAG: 50S ribosomal protein L11 methyltransferase [Desulfatibacillaceae bacterium]|nr:50S ribosomal protein L11 methyltransferase [Desulfatibacillaceae bacterium]